MKKSQLNAISYYYSNKRKEEEKSECEKLNLLTAFDFQSQFKTIKGFLNAYKNKSQKFALAKEEAIKRIDLKIKSVEGSNNNPGLVKKLKEYNEFLKSC